MPKANQHKHRDVEKNYPRKKFIEKIHRLAACLEQGKPFRIQIAGVRVTIPAGASIGLEHERGITSEEVEFQLKWKP